MDKISFMKKQISKRKKEHRFRVMKEVLPFRGAEIFAEEKKMINFCSNDYLGLSKHPLLAKRAIEYIDKYGTGSTASRMICGTFDCFNIVEEKLAELKGTEAALILNSGYQANISILPAITDKKSLILSDSLNHNSIIQGALLSRCTILKFRHNDLQHLRNLLEKNYNEKFSRIVIVSESIFSVDGDECDIAGLADLSSEFKTLLVIDEAHATGVAGKGGMGLARGKQADFIIGTFGKGCGSFGAYVACSRIIKEYLINCCTGFIYSTALPPSVIGSIDAALDLIPQMNKERHGIKNKAKFLRDSLSALGLSTENSTTQIIPVMIGKEANSLEVARYLSERNILALAIRPPTVPEGKARIRIAVSALHEQYHLKSVIKAFRGFVEDYDWKNISKKNFYNRHRYGSR